MSNAATPAANATTSAHKTPQNPVSINTLYPAELPNTGKVGTYHGPAPRLDRLLDYNYDYYPNRRYYNNKYHYKKYYPRSWY